MKKLNSNLLRPFEVDISCLLAEDVQVPFGVVFCVVLSCCVVSCLVLSCASCLVLSCCVLSCPVVSCLVFSSLVVFMSCLVLARCGLSCLVASSFLVPASFVFYVLLCFLFVIDCCSRRRRWSHQMMSTCRRQGAESVRNPATPV